MKNFFLLILFINSFFNTAFADMDNSAIKTQDKCDQCSVEDDEYCVYNQCYFDRHYRLMKKKLCITSEQEKNIDSIYQEFKYDLEILCSRYKNKKNKILSMIDYSNKNYKEEIDDLKDIKKDIKDRIKCFKHDVKQCLCKEQYKKFRSFSGHEKRKIKRIMKYGKIYKFPCNEQIN